MSMKTVIVASAFVVIPMVAGVQTQNPVDVPRTAWGHPDLQGGLEQQHGGALAASRRPRRQANADG